MWFQIFYYNLTTYTTIGLTITSFITNFIFWVVELVKFDNLFHDTYLNDNYKILPIVLGGLLWGLNKLIIDKILKLLKMKLLKSCLMKNYVWLKIKILIFF